MLEAANGNGLEAVAGLGEVRLGARPVGGFRRAHLAGVRGSVSGTRTGGTRHYCTVLTWGIVHKEHLLLISTIPKNL